MNTQTNTIPEAEIEEIEEIEEIAALLRQVNSRIRKIVLVTLRTAIQERDAKAEAKSNVIDIKSYL